MTTLTGHDRVIKMSFFFFVIAFPRGVSNAVRQQQLWSSELEIHTVGKCIMLFSIYCATVTVGDV